MKYNNEPETPIQPKSAAAMGNSYLASSWRLRLDYRLGLRAWGLVLYGVFPASLAALGALKVPDFSQRPEHVLLPLVLIAGLPFLVLYLLIRERLSAWYLLEWSRWSRSAFLTAAILLLSATVSAAAGMVEGRYEWVGVAGLEALGGAQALIEPVAESMLLASVVLVGSSTLFLTVIKGGSTLPALPTGELAQGLATLRAQLREIRNRSPWASEENASAKELKAAIDTARSTASRLAETVAPRSARGGFFAALEADLRSLEQARSAALGAPRKWQVLFGDLDGPANRYLWRRDLELREAVRRVRGLCADA